MSDAPDALLMLIAQAEREVASSENRCAQARDRMRVSQEALRLAEQALEAQGARHDREVREQAEALASSARQGRHLRVSALSLEADALAGIGQRRRILAREVSMETAATVRAEAALDLELSRFEQRLEKLVALEFQLAEQRRERLAVSVAAAERSRAEHALNARHGTPQKAGEDP